MASAHDILVLFRTLALLPGLLRLAR